MSFEAGSAYSEYRLRLEGFYADIRAAERGLRNLQAAAERTTIEGPRLTGTDAAATAGARQAAELARINATIAQQQARAQQATAQSAAAAGIAEARLAEAQNRTATSAQRLTAAQNQTAASSQRLARETAQAAAAQSRAELAALRYAQAQQRGAEAAAGYSRLGASVRDALVQAAGSFGLVTSGAAGLIAVMNQVREAFNLQASLTGTQQQFRTLTGDVDKANQKIRGAEQFADRYRIKTTEINQTLAAGAGIFRESTAATELQLSALTRLASLNAAEGINGAVFALKELTSASTAGEAILSLNERFNVSKELGRQLFEEYRAGGDVFVALDKVLNQLNVTEEVLENRTMGVVGAQNAAARSTEEFQLAIGRLVEGPGTALLNLYSQAAQGATVFVQELSGQTSAIDAGNGSLVASAATYAEYTARVREAGGATAENAVRQSALFQALAAANPALAQLALNLAGAKVRTDELSAAQFAYVQSLIATGTAEGEAIARAQEQGQALATLQTVITTSAGALDLYQGRIYAAAAASDANLAALQSLLVAYSTGQINLEQFAATLTAIESTSRAAAAAEAEQAGATQTAAEAAAQAAAESNKAAFARVQQAAEAEQAKIREEELERAILAAAAAGGPAEQAAAAIAAKFNGVEAPAVLNLINLHRQLAAARGAQAPGFGGGVPRDLIIAQRASQESQKRLNYERELALQTGTTAEKLAIVTRLLTVAPKYSAEALRLETQRRQLLDQQAREAAAGGRAGGGGGGGRGGARGGRTPAEAAAEREQKAQQKADDQRLDLARETARKLEDLEREHGERMLSIQAEYARRQLEAEGRLRVDSLNSRADFYDALTQATPEIGQAAAEGLSAAYEAAFAEAQRLAQDGQAALAAEFLNLRQQQIQDELAAQQKIAAAREKKDAAEVDRLTRIEELRRLAREEELKQLLEGGDDNVNARDAALTEEQRKYQERAGEIGAAADEKATRIETAEARALRGIQTTNQALADQLSLTQQIAGAGGPARATLPAAAAQATPTTTTTGQAAAPGQQAAPTAAPGAAGTVTIDAPALQALLDALRADVTRLAGVVDTLPARYDALIAAERATTDAVNRSGTRKPGN